ncbi:MAG: hypothetical protein JJU20_12140 [Opitutales bacterium]|nr:hypothetical protein [Opitutales bacterium]
MELISSEEVFGKGDRAGDLLYILGYGLIPLLILLGVGIHHTDGYKYFLRGDGPVYLLAIAGCMAFAAAKIPAVARAFKGAAAIEPSTLYFDTYPVNLGDSFSVKYNRKCADHVVIEEIVPVLKCEAHMFRHSGTRVSAGGSRQQIISTAYAAELPAFQPAQISPGLWGGAFEFVIPAGGVPTFSSTYHRYVWAIELKTSLSSMPDALSRFEIEVNPQLSIDAY